MTTPALESSKRRAVGAICWPAQAASGPFSISFVPTAGASHMMRGTQPKCPTPTFSMRTSGLGRLSMLTPLAASRNCWSDGWRRWLPWTANEATAADCGRGFARYRRRERRRWATQGGRCSSKRSPPIPSAHSSLTQHGAMPKPPSKLRTRASMSSRISRMRSMPSTPRSDGSSVSQFSKRVPSTGST